jgi:hypothetical protein
MHLEVVGFAFQLCNLILPVHVEDILCLASETLGYLVRGLDQIDLSVVVDLHLPSFLGICWGLVLPQRGRSIELVRGCGIV